MKTELGSAKEEKKKLIKIKDYYEGWIFLNTNIPGPLPK